MDVKCPACASNQIKPSRRRGKEKIYPLKPYRCRKCKERFFVLQNPLSSPLFWLLSLGTLVFLFFILQAAIDHLDPPAEIETAAHLEQPPVPQADKPAADNQPTEAETPLLPEPTISSPISPHRQAEPEKPLTPVEPEPTKQAGPQPSVVPAGPMTLQDVDITQQADFSQVVIRADRPIKNHKHFFLPNPARLVIDLAGKWQKPSQTRYEGENKRIKAVRVGNHPEKFRIVLDLTAEAPFRWTISEKSGKLLIIIKTRP